MQATVVTDLHLNMHNTRITNGAGHRDSKYNKTAFSWGSCLSCITRNCKLGFQVGKLIFLTNSRLNMSFAINLINCFIHFPLDSHLVATKHILCYLACSMDIGIFFLPRIHLYNLHIIEMQNGVHVGKQEDPLEHILWLLVEDKFLGQVKDNPQFYS